jgi:2-C-methyl-D-erythritol 4-phosphate cytidylyltransferase
MRVFVILPAAGLGTRMAAGNVTPGAPKQFLELRGTPILIHTLRAFAELPSVAAVYIAVRKPEISRLQALLEAHGFGSSTQTLARRASATRWRPSMAVTTISFWCMTRFGHSFLQQ